MPDALTVISLLAPILVATILYRLVTHRLLPRVERRRASLVRASRPSHATGADPETQRIDAARRAA